jgi:hypothetical protein
MVEGSAEETALLIQARMPTQAQEIDGRVLINDLGTHDGLTLNPGDLAIVEITELADMDLVAKLVRVEKPATQPTAGLTTRISKGLEMRSGSVAH